MNLSNDVTEINATYRNDPFLERRSRTFEKYRKHNNFKINDNAMFLGTGTIG